MFWIVVIMIAYLIVYIPLLLKRKQYRELKAFLVLWFVATFYGIIVLSNIRLISPFEIIQEVILLLYGANL